MKVIERVMYRAICIHCDLNIRALGLSRTDIYITFTCKFTSANGQGIDYWSHRCNMMPKT